jgi:hypothetical protein
MRRGKKEQIGFAELRFFDKLRMARSKLWAVMLSEVKQSLKRE